MEDKKELSLKLEIHSKEFLNKRQQAYFKKWQIKQFKLIILKSLQSNANIILITYFHLELYNIKPIFIWFDLIKKKSNFLTIFYLIVDNKKNDNENQI